MKSKAVTTLKSSNGRWSVTPSIEGQEGKTDSDELYDISVESVADNEKLELQVGDNDDFSEEVKIVESAKVQALELEVA